VVDWSDPQTFWLNVTNAVLGLVTLIALVAVAGAVVVDIVHRLRERVAAADIDPHAYLVPGLGATMADGGETVKDEKK
jgi:hypothetical protein